MRIIYEKQNIPFLKRVALLSLRSYILFSVFYGTILCIGHFYIFWEFWWGYFLGLLFYTIRYCRRAMYQLIKLSIDNKSVYIYFSKISSKKNIYIPIEEFSISFSEVWINIYTLNFFSNHKLALKLKDSQLLKIKEMEEIFLYFKDEFPQSIRK